MKLTLGFKRSEEFQRPPIEDTQDISDKLAALEQLDRLEESLAKVLGTDPEAAMVAAAEDLKTFPLTRLARKLLDQAMDNVSKSTGSGMTDDIARDKIQSQAALVSACGNDLTTTVQYLSEALEDDPLSIANSVYSICFSVMKAVVFIGNMQYRRSLDPRGDYDLEKYVDYREEEREAPYGLGRDVPDEFDCKMDAWSQIETAVDDLRAYLQLLTEAFGWDPERPMPFLNTTDDDGVTFTPIHDVITAFDITQVKSQASRAKRAAKQSAAMLNAAKRARAALGLRK